MIRAQANREAVNQLKRPAKREDRKASVWTAMTLKPNTTTCTLVVLRRVA